MRTRNCVIIVFLLLPALLYAGPTVGFTEIASPGNLVIPIPNPGFVGGVFNYWSSTELGVLSFKNTSGQTFTDFHIIIDHATENLANKTYTLDKTPFFDKAGKYWVATNTKRVTLDFWCGTGIEDGKSFRVDVSGLPTGCQFKLEATITPCDPKVPVPGSLLLGTIGIGCVSRLRKRRSI